MKLITSKHTPLFDREKFLPSPLFVLKEALQTQGLFLF
ncbi:hypothetical protein AB434_2347 [Heyndrickxia coagulans]|uniref:Uncharacterized protein n=1 Tax=Heyndrickxia coagulans TaxID=1398 RepID=A0AAN0T8W8_HEYCO|nr:hypothetical protein SB48_HM08orf04727 [Heyndrickxia coagulans]AKN54752.1 hypothetical protein AB434_2347 [Heyndrickxia coagulans]KYC84183.1 hypothetical protein B4096_0290 [Heyndrickxia coagulans]